jgi:MFS family permease
MTATGVLMISAATLGDRWGRRPVYTGGLLLFTVASAVCALAPGAGTFIVARAVQRTVGAAAVMPLALALLNAAFPPACREWPMSVFGSVTGLPTVLGPVFGGVITQALSWSWIFWINVPVGVATPVAVLLRVRDSRRAQRSLDPLGLVLGGQSAVALVWGVVQAVGTGWGDGTVLGLFLAGVVALAALVVWARRAVQPMVPLRLFADRTFSAGNAGIFLPTDVVFFTAQFFQDAPRVHWPLGCGCCRWALFLCWSRRGPAPGPTASAPQTRPRPGSTDRGLGRRRPGATKAAVGSPGRPASAR